MFRRIINSSFLSGSAVYLFSNILAAAIPFALLPILTRYLTPAEYGQVAIFQTLLAGLGAFIGISAQGLAGVKYYDSQLSKLEQKYFLGNCLIVLAATTAFTLLLAVIFGQVLSNWIALDAQWLMLSVFVTTAAFVATLRMGQWQARKHTKSYGVFQVSQALINMLLSLVVVVHFLQGAAGRIWVLSITTLVYAAIALFLLYKDDLLGFAWRPGYLRELFAFGLPLMPHTVGNFLLLSVDRFVINEQLGLAQVGIYIVAVQLASIIGMMIESIHNAYVPWLYERLKRNEFDEKKQIVRWTYVYFIALMGVVLLAFTIGPLLLEIIAGPMYSEASNIVGWLVLGQAFSGMYLMVTAYIFYSKRTGLLSLSTMTSGLINVGLLMFLISFMGLIGAAVAFAISMAIKFLLTWYIANLRHPMPWFTFQSAA
jgi:O-antigen/teichoic acid export membrane protein